MNKELNKHRLELHRNLQEIEDKYEEKMRKSNRYGKIAFIIWLIIFVGYLIYIFY